MNVAEELDGLTLDPAHPGELVRCECIEPLGLTVTAAAKALGVSRKTLDNLVNGRAGVSPEMAVRLATAFGGSAKLWIDVQSAHDLAQVQRREAEIRATVTPQLIRDPKPANSTPAQKITAFPQQKLDGETDAKPRGPQI